MNPVERLIRRVDRWQQRYTATAFTFAVIKKYGDDNSGQLVASLSHTAFVSLFPLLLVLTTILGIVAAGNSALRHEVVSAVAGQFPVISKPLTANVHQLRQSSVIGLAVGVVVALWGSSGLAQSGMFAMAQVWNLPGPDRPGYWQRLGRAGLFLLVLGAGVMITTLLTSFGTWGSSSPGYTVLAEVAAAAANIGMYTIGFRVLTPKVVPVRRLLPGAVLAGLGWTAL
ncbi:MAG TPA: YhjD/YihY/BrkB family envelope integrity protein, partial [Streptosporangiaceae bacterium]|nr:YhjD/YihY/BrkB family envelope integrity protein [Streptosporangiaceae bacterium]